MRRLHLASNHNAAHPIKRHMNYASAAVESEIRIRAISDGSRPTIGVMHEGRGVLDFNNGHVFDPADFVIRSDGVERLNPEMARMVVARVST